MAGTSYKNYFDLNEILKTIRNYLPDLDKKRFQDAFDFAERAHKGQLRKDEKTPYIVHPIETVKILTAIHADEDTLISALLHDVPEDTKYDLLEIKQKFGEKIAFLVDGITKLSKVHYRYNMPERQIESLKKLLLHSAEDLRVVLIKLADRLNNMETLGNLTDKDKRLRIATETLEIYVPIANLLGLRDIKCRLEDLCFKYLFPDDYEKISKKVQSFEAKNNEIFEKFKSRVEEILKTSGIAPEIIIRRKNLYSVYKKIRSIGKAIEDIDNRLPITIVVDNVGECYQVLGAIHGVFVPKTDRFKDYIANPKINAYQSLHTTVFGVDGSLTEIQIRTKKMNIEAEYGVAAGFFLGKSGAENLKGSLWLNKILDMEKKEKTSDDFLEDLKLDVFEDRIFAFTPKGEPVDLPKGASVLDFAYAIHTELGHHADKAEVGSEIKRINAALKTGDVVNIITSRKIKPELAWLSFVKTNLARNKILAYLKKVSKGKKIEEGYSVLQKEFDIAGLGLCKDVNFKKLKKNLAERLGEKFKDMDELFIAVGDGTIKSADVLRCMDRKIKTEKGMRIHIKILAKNRFRLMRDVSDVLYKHALDMYSLKGWASKYEKNACFTAELLVANSNSISRMFDELEQIDEIRSVHIVSQKGVVLFCVATSLLITAWIFHPFILRFADRLSSRYTELSDLLVYGSFLLLFVTLFYLSSVIKKYFPVVRNKKLLWMAVFTIPLIAIGMLAVEILYFNLKLSWFIILIEILLIYGYLGMNYRNFRKSMRQT